MVAEGASERLERLLFLRRVQLQELARTDRWIRQERLRLSDPARTGERGARPAGPAMGARGWVVFTPEPVLDPPQLHVAGCGVRTPPERTRRIGQEELTRLAELGATLCTECDPLQNLRSGRP
ncbi:hypothetical protein ACFYXL_22295 [Streptomyces tsukubensis]|uniref:hypothetical protein n=1 Tax=Streptomyces tsukubensis TaxID=83656 RepID=UPI0036BA85ED